MHVLVTSIPLRYFKIFGVVIALLCTLFKCTVCVQSLVDVASLVLRFLFTSKFGQISLLDHGL